MLRDALLFMTATSRRAAAAQDEDQAAQEALDLSRSIRAHEDGHRHPVGCWTECRLCRFSNWIRNSRQSNVKIARVFTKSMMEIPWPLQQTSVIPIPVGGVSYNRGPQPIGGSPPKKKEGTDTLNNFCPSLILSTHLDMMLLPRCWVSTNCLTHLLLSRLSCVGCLDKWGHLTFLRVPVWLWFSKETTRNEGSQPVLVVSFCDPKCRSDLTLPLAAATKNTL